MGQRQIAQALGLSQPAVSQQLHGAAKESADVHLEAVIAAAGPSLALVAE